MYAILKGKEVVECDLMTWASYYERNMGGTSSRVVRQTPIGPTKQHIMVSTVFLGIEHGYEEKQWFETMVFGSSISDSCERYATYDEALRGHEKHVHRARQARWTRFNRWTTKHRRKNLKELRKLSGWFKTKTKARDLTKVTYFDEQGENDGLDSGGRDESAGADSASQKRNQPDSPRDFGHGESSGAAFD